MHNYITGCKLPLEIDHIDGNPLNNQKLNLRIVTHQQNMFNSRIRYKDKYKGVSYHKRDKKYTARIRHNNILYWLGYYKTAEDAAKAYDKAAKEKFGEFAYLNFKNK